MAELEKLRKESAAKCVSFERASAENSESIGLHAQRKAVDYHASKRSVFGTSWAWRLVAGSVSDGPHSNISPQPPPASPPAG